MYLNGYNEEEAQFLINKTLEAVGLQQMYVFQYGGKDDAMDISHEINLEGQRFIHYETVLLGKSINDVSRREMLETAVDAVIHKVRSKLLNSKAMMN